MLGRFDRRLSLALPGLAPAEQRLARQVAGRKERVILGTAQQIAAWAGTSDATVLRMVRAMGYASLADLREELLADMTETSSPASRMAETLAQAGTGPAPALAHVVDQQEAHLRALRDPDLAQAFAAATRHLARARAVHVFGIGPSGLMADYLALQLGRMGRLARAMTASGVALADQLMALRPGDAVVAIAYAPIYREIRAVLARAAALDLPVILISDSLAPLVAGQFACHLEVPRGRAEHLALHSATMVVIEALALSLAGQDPDGAMVALDDFATLRAGIDAAWTKRGTRRNKSPLPPAADAAPTLGDFDA